MLAHIVIGLGFLTSYPDSTAQELIHSALDCEARGQEGDRLRFLELAVQADPASPTARGLLGQIKIDGQWQSPDAATGRERSHDGNAALLAQYEARRAATPDTAAGQWKLA